MSPHSWMPAEAYLRSLGIEVDPILGDIVEG